MIPDIPQIRESFAALRVVESSPVPATDRQMTICQKHCRIYPDHTVAEDETVIVLTQEGNAPMPIPRLIDRVAEELHKQGHAHSLPRTDYRASLAQKLVGLVATIHPLFANPLDAVNGLLQSLSEARVIQWAVLINPSTGADQYSFGDFSYGELDLATLRSRCDRAGSDFFDLHGDRLQRRRSVCRDGRMLKTLDINSFKPPGTVDAATQVIVTRLYDDYFADLADAERRLFLADLDRQQAIYGAAGLGTIPADSLMRMSALSQWITVFTRQKKGHGWVVPNQSVFQVNSTEPRALAQGQGEITRHLKLEDWQKRPLDPSIQNYCHYLTAAQDHERNGSVEEALLHLVFGLDLLLGGQAGEALTTVLAERVAFLAHLALAQPLEDVANFVRECYDLRSGYVHRGGKGVLGDGKGSISLRERLDRLSQVARAVLGAGCYARLQPWGQVEDARHAWLKRIDVLRAKHDAGLGVNDADLTEMGLKQVKIRDGGLPCVVIE